MAKSTNEPQPLERSPRLSVLAPCFDEEEVLPLFYARAVAAAEAAVGGDYEIVLVNDGSRDGTWQVIATLAAGNPRVVGIDLSRNFGHQFALTAGLSFARGEIVLVIDADLQDPPELLGDMLALLNDGADVVFGQRVARDGESPFKRRSARLFYRLLERLSDVPIPRDTGDFRLMRRAVVDAFVAMPEHNRFVRGMVAWIGFRQVPLPYRREPRHAGRSKYPVGRMLRLAVDAITSFSIVPLRLTSLLGLFFCLVAFAVGAYALASYLLAISVPGWTSIIGAVSLVGGVQLLCLGIIGEYLGRVYLEVKQRPPYLVREVRVGGAPVERALAPEQRDPAPHVSA